MTEYLSRPIWTRINFTGVILAVFVLLFGFSNALYARPASLDQAKQSVKGWLKADPKPLATFLPAQIKDAVSFPDEQDEPLYYVIYLQPEGFVIVPADDEVEPIIAFAPSGTFDPSMDNPLGALVSQDLPDRIGLARNLPGKRAALAQDQKEKLEKATRKARRQWTRLQKHAGGKEVQDTDEEAEADGEVGDTGYSTVSDIRVAPLVTSTWNQGNAGGGLCYNYYTPNNYVCGCVATAFAQILRYHQYPTVGVGTPSFTIEVDGSSQSRSLRGGNGAGGPYAWAEMPLNPNSSMTTAQRQAIGALCHDAGVSVNMEYTSNSSGAQTYDVKDRIKSVFFYANAIATKSSSRLSSDLNNMLNPNLDAKKPCQLGIKRDSNGHSIVCDGYGYSGSTLYHHLNLGWGGSYTAWYNLPNIDSSPSYNTISSCVYNIFPTGGGEIISGRVVDTGGFPIAGATVTATGNYTATTDDNGIYALIHLPSNTNFTISVSKPGWTFSAPKSMSTGKSQSDYIVLGVVINSYAPGNRWNNNFTGTSHRGMLELDKSMYVNNDTIAVTLIDAGLIGQGTQAITLQSCADSETLALYETPANSGYFTGSIYVTYGTPTTEDGILHVTGSQNVIAIYEDSDNGAGSAETIQTTAAIKPWFALYSTDFAGGLPAGWSIVDGLSDGITWKPGQPADIHEEYRPYVSDHFMICNSDAQQANLDEQLITPSLNCSAMETVILEFNHLFRYYAYDNNEVGDVDIRVNGGAWQNLLRYEAVQDYSGVVQSDLTSYAAGQPNIQIRWRYYDAWWDYYWCINNIMVFGQYPVESIPSDLSGDCRVDIEDLVIFAENWLIHY